MNAPAIDMIGPDIYSDSSDFVLDAIRTYHRPDNPLWIPEIGSSDNYAKGFPQQDGIVPPGTKDAHGRAMVAQLGPDEFLMTGFDASVAFHVPGRLPGLRMQILRAEEGQFEENGSGHNVWKPLRLWNGDETDRGLNFRQQPTWVRIQVGQF